MARMSVERDGREDDLRAARLEAERMARSALVTLRDAWDGLRIAERSLGYKPVLVNPRPIKTAADVREILEIAW